MSEVCNETASIKELASKTVCLLSLATFWRPKSDLSRIKLENVEINGDILTLISSLPKEGISKETTISRHEDKNVCPVHAVEKYIQRTLASRSELCTNLFITYKRPFKNASGDTLGRWIQETICNACNIKKFKPHQLRSTSSSLALHMGMPLEQVLNKANWKSSKTFKNQYYRPPANYQNRVHVVNSINCPPLPPHRSLSTSQGLQKTFSLNKDTCGPAGHHQNRVHYVNSLILYYQLFESLAIFIVLKIRFLH